MSTDEILLELKSKRTTQKDIHDAAGKELAKLDAAIAALNGHQPKENGKTVPEMVLECCLEFAKAHAAPGLKVAISRQNIISQAEILFPTSLRKIKTGIYNAIVALRRKQKSKCVRVDTNCADEHQPFIASRLREARERRPMRSAFDAGVELRFAPRGCS